MIRGTSAKFKFTLPCDFSELESANIVFWQKGNSGPDESRPLPIIKVLEQCEQSTNTNELYIALNQEETLRFIEDEKAYVQLVVETITGKHIASREEMITVYPIYDDAILGDNVLPTPGYNPETGTIKVDNVLSETSKNPVQNKVITTNLKQLQYAVDTIYSQVGENIVPNLLPIVTSADNDKMLRVVDGMWTLANITIDSDDFETDTTLSIAGAAADAKITGDRLNELSAQIDKLLYVPISITSFKHNVSNQEIGSTLETLRLSWVINKTPTTLILTPSTEAELVLEANGYVDVHNISSTTTWTLTAYGENGETSSVKASIGFYNGVYYGASEKPNTYDSSFILSLKKELRKDKLSSINVTAANNQYIYYCLPVSYGKCSFTLGGFAGGFELVDTISFTNSSGLQEDYYVYESSYSNLGNPKITIA